VGRLLNAAGYTLQSNRNTREGGDHPDRNAQFAHSNATVLAFQKQDQPVIAVATKKLTVTDCGAAGSCKQASRGRAHETGQESPLL
jgi:hypothetical protein